MELRKVDVTEGGHGDHGPHRVDHDRAHGSARPGSRLWVLADLAEGEDAHYYYYYYYYYYYLRGDEITQVTRRQLDADTYAVKVPHAVARSWSEHRY